MIKNNFTTGVRTVLAEYHLKKKIKNYTYIINRLRLANYRELFYYWRATSSHRIPFLAIALLCHFS